MSDQLNRLKIEAWSRELGASVKRSLARLAPDRPIGFVLSIFDFERDEHGNAWEAYLSNANRADTVRHLRELADRLEAGIDRPEGSPS